MIISLKHTLDAVLNHKQMGKVSTEEYNAILTQVVMDIQNKLFADFRKLNFKKMKWQDTPNYGNEASYLRQAIEYFIRDKEVSLGADGSIDLNNAISDLLLLNSVFTDKAESEKVDLSVFNKLLRLNRAKPTECMPVHTYNSGILRVSPKVDKVMVNYFRKGKKPKLPCKIVRNTEVFVRDTDMGFQDIDLHPIMIEAVFLEMLGLFGVNLQDQFAMQMSDKLKQEAMLDKQ